MVRRRSEALGRLPGINPWIGANGPGLEADRRSARRRQRELPLVYECFAGRPDREETVGKGSGTGRSPPDSHGSPIRRDGVRARSRSGSGVVDTNPSGFDTEDPSAAPQSMVVEARRGAPDRTAVSGNPRRRTRIVPPRQTFGSRARSWRIPGLSADSRPRRRQPGRIAAGPPHRSSSAQSVTRPWSRFGLSLGLLFRDARPVQASTARSIAVADLKFAAFLNFVPIHGPQKKGRGPARQRQRGDFSVTDGDRAVTCQELAPGRGYLTLRRECYWSCGGPARLSRYPTPRTVSRCLPAVPSLWRRRLMWVSKVRLSTP